MVELGDDETPEAEQIASDADRHHEAWGVTFDDMIAMADELEDGGWETVRIPTGDSGPFDPSSDRGGEGAFSFAHVTPGDKAEIATGPFEATSLPEYEMYRTENDGRVYIVTALLSSETETTAFIMSAWDFRKALECATVTAEGGWMHSYLQKFDNTVVSVIEHDDPERSFPDLDAIRRYTPNNDGEGGGGEN